MSQYSSSSSHWRHGHEHARRSGPCRSGSPHCTESRSTRAQPCRCRARHVGRSGSGPAAQPRLNWTPPRRWLLVLSVLIGHSCGSQAVLLAQNDCVAEGQLRLISALPPELSAQPGRPATPLHNHRNQRSNSSHHPRAAALIGRVPEAAQEVVHVHSALARLSEIHQHRDNPGVRQSPATAQARKPESRFARNRLREHKGDPSSQTVLLLRTAGASA